MDAGRVRGPFLFCVPENRQTGNDALLVLFLPIFCYNVVDTYVRLGEGDVFLRILGIDPGIAIVGFGFIDKAGSKLTPVQYGSIQTEAHTPLEERLLQVYEATLQLIDKYKPDTVAMEKLFFNRNVTTAFTVGQARGVMILAAVQRGLSVAEYTPLQVKQAVVGYGKAEKRQVQEMVKMFLRLQAVPKPDDVADALAVAVCHAHSYTLQQKVNEVLR